jgi:hypothetical protein
MQVDLLNPKNNTTGRESQMEKNGGIFPGRVGFFSFSGLHTFQ